jgi:hypothetical protein
MSFTSFEAVDRTKAVERRGTFPPRGAQAAVAQMPWLTENWVADIAVHVPYPSPKAADALGRGAI